jgi:hypothetical protein
MACEFICDGCGKRQKAIFTKRGAPGWFKPGSWFQRQDDDGPQDACSRECIEKIAMESGKTDVVLPI